MGNIKENIAIKIFNYNPFGLCVVTNQREIILPICDDYSFPTFEVVSFNELSYINSKSTSIRSGLIQFENDMKNDIYNALEICNWQDIITNQQLEDTIINPTYSKLEKLVAITDRTIYDRIMPIYQSLVNSGQYDISNRVSYIIKARNDELRKNKYKSDIVIKKSDDNEISKKTDVSEVQKQNEELQLQLLQMKEMMNKLLEAQSTKSDVDNVNKTVTKTANKPTVKKTVAKKTK